MTVSNPGPIRPDLASSQRRWDEAADRVVRATVGGAEGDLPAAMVGMMSARRGFEASLAVTRARDQMLGTLIDTLA